MKFSAKELYTIYFSPLEYVVKVRMDKSQLGKVDATSVKFGNKQLVVYREMKVLVSFASNVANIRFLSRLFGNSIVTSKRLI